MKNTKSWKTTDSMQNWSNIIETENELLKQWNPNNISDYYTCRGGQNKLEFNNSYNSSLNNLKPYEKATDSCI